MKAACPHAAFERRFPEWGEYARGLDDDANRRLLAGGRSETDFMSARTFPCRGTLRVLEKGDKDVDGEDIGWRASGVGENKLLECDRCGFEIVASPEALRLIGGDWER